MMITDLAALTEEVVEDPDPRSATRRLLDAIVRAIRQLSVDDDPEKVDRFADELDAASDDLSIGVVRNSSLDDGSLDPEPKGRAMGAAGLGQEPAEDAPRLQD
jgi:hypothetical protein